jgi:glutaredoxin 3
MKKVKIYTTHYCPYCDSAKRLFSQLNISYEEISLEDNNELRDRLSRENGGWRTVPMIFVGEQFVGGYTDAAQLHRDGKLLPLVQND